MFNMMAQKDNDVNIDIARATRIDSAAMKTIAVVTLTFLPATYVSVRSLAHPVFLGYLSLADNL